MIRPVFTNTAFVPTRERIILRGGGWKKVSLRVRCGLIVHPNLGPVLIDAGYGPRVTQGRRGLALTAYASLLRPVLNPLESPLALLFEHGFLPEDVSLVILTHLHADHISYLRDLPNARFITDGQITGRVRHGVFSELLPDDFASRYIDMRGYAASELPFGLGRGFDVLGDGSVLPVPLPGHAPGHFGVFFPGDRPLLYGTYTQWVMQAVTETRAPGLPASATHHDRTAAVDSTERVRRFASEGGEVVLCHDPAPSPYDWAPSNV